jgi:HlyD family secretion protein
MSEQTASAQHVILERPTSSTNGHGPSGWTPKPAAPAGKPGGRALVLVGLAFLLSVAAVATWHVFLAAPALPPGVVPVSGRIEGDDAAVAAKTAGRIREITVREGDRVEANQLIALLDDAQVRAREQQAEATLRQSRARTRVAQHHLAVLDEQLRQNQLGVDQAHADAQGRVAEADARLAAAEMQLAQAQATHAQAKWDRDAYTQLFERRLIAEQQARQAQSNEESQAALVAASRRQVEAARGALTAAQASLVNPAIRASQVSAVRGQILQAQADVAAAEADAERARAMLEEARADRADLRVLAPFAGTVATRTAEPGEVVTAGTPIVMLVNLTEVYLRAFVPEGQIGRVRVGQAARVYLDSAPSQPIEAVVGRIDPTAAFTPENTYFREDRVMQVVGVKLFIRGAVGFAKPGMPADGEILVEGAEWPAGRKRR